MDFLRMLWGALADELFPPRDQERIVRVLPENALCAQLAPQLVERCSPPAIALLIFRISAVRAAVHEAKFRGNAKAQRMLGAVLADYLREWSVDEGAFENGGQSAGQKVLLVPIPLSKSRKKERGYNQCEEILKCALAALVQNTSPKLLPFALETSLLQRARDTEHQTRLSRLLRRQNLTGAFAASRSADPNALYIVVDDVVTTGATFQAAIDALHAAGAKRVLPLALTH